MKRRTEKKRQPEETRKNAKILFCETHDRKTRINTLKSMLVSEVKMKCILLSFCTT